MTTPFLDSFAVAPRWAHHIGLQLRTGQVSPGRVVRALDNDEMDLTFTGGVTDLAALAAFANGSVCRLIKVYNASLVGPTELLPVGGGAAAIVYDGSAPILGDNGLLAAYFDHLTPEAGGQGYATNAELPEFVGDPNITHCFDGKASQPTDYFRQFVAGLYSNALGPQFSTQVYFDSAVSPPVRLQIRDSHGGSVQVSNGDPPAVWSQWNHGAGDRANKIALLRAGVSAATAVSPNAKLDLQLATLRWGNQNYGANLMVIASTMFLWNAALSSAQQSQLNAQMNTSYA